MNTDVRNDTLPANSKREAATQAGWLCEDRAKKPKDRRLRIRDPQTTYVVEFNSAI